MLIVMKNSSLIMGTIKVDAYKCERCGHIWLPRETTKSQNRKPITWASVKVLTGMYLDQKRRAQSKK